MTLEQIVIGNIKRIRKEKRITQERLAEYCETSVSYIGLMETYKNIPKLSTIERIAEALNVPVLDLFSAEAAARPLEETERGDERRRKIRERMKRELLRRMRRDLDDVLQLV